MPYLTQEEIDSGILDKFKNYDPAEVKKQHELAWNNSPGYQDLFEGKEQYDPGKVESPSGVVPDRGFVGDVSSNLAMGAGDLVRMGGYALKTIDPDGGIGVLEKAGDKMIGASKYAEKNFDIMKMDESEAAGEGFLSRGWKGGVRSAVPSVSPVVAGGLAGSVFGPVGALVGAGIGTLGLFGFGIYGEKRQEYIDQGIEEPEAEKAAFKQALIEGGIETAGSLIGLKIFGVDKFITQPLKQSLKELIETPLSTWGKKLATDTFLNEIPTEMLQEALGAQVETGLGLQGEGAWREAMVEAIVPAMVMSLGFGLGSQGLTMVNKRNLKNQINNIDDPKARLKAVEAIEKGILAHEAGGDDTGITKNAEAWSAMAMDRIEEGKPIELNTDFVAYATNGEDALGAMRGRVGEGMAIEYRDKLTKRINNLSLFRSLTPRQKEIREQYLIELANVDKEIASQQQNKTKTTDPAQQVSQNIIGPESDQFEQFQEGIRDQKIGEFEQNLKQAQTDITEYPDRPPIQPDIESLRKEWEERKAKSETNAQAPATSRRQLIADESNTFDDFLYNIQSDIFENNLRSAQADIQPPQQQAPIQPDVEALRREYENKQAHDGTEAEVTTPKLELEQATGMGLKDKGQQAFVDQRIQKLGSIDAVDKAYGRDDNVSQYARAKASEVFGQNVTETIPAEPSKKGMSFDEFEKEYRAAFNDMSKYGADQVGAEHFAAKMAALSDAHPDWAEMVENNQFKNVKIPPITRVENQAPLENQPDNTPNTSEPSAPILGIQPTIKEKMSVAPGQSVTWKDKKGKVLSGKVVKKQSEAGSAWQVIKPDGKKTFVHEKYLSPVDAAANNPQVQDQGEVYVSGSDQVDRGSQSQKNDTQRGLPSTGEPQTLAEYDIPSNTLKKAKEEAKRADAIRLVYQHPQHKHWIVSSRGPWETHSGKVHSVMPNGSVDIWRDGIEKSLEPEQEAETTEKQPWKMNLLEYGKSRLPVSQAEHITDSKHVKSFSAQHRNEVNAAIDRGERVPKSVLEDHPDLARKYDDKVAKWEMIKSTGMDWIRYVPVEKSSDNDTTAIHESSQPVQTVTNHVVPKPDSNLKTIDELSDRIESIDRQISKLENIDNQSDFDEKNAKIKKLNARKDSLWGKRSSLLSEKKQDNTIEKFEYDLSRKGTGSIQSDSGRIDYSIQAKDDGNGFYFQYVEDGARYTKGGAGPNRWSQQEAIDRAVADAKGRAGDTAGTGKKGNKSATLKDITESKLQVGDTVQFKKASRSHRYENEHVIDDILSNGKIVLAGNNNLPYRHEFHRDDFKKIKPSNSDKKDDRADYGAKNKVFTAEAADKARELLRKKLSGNQLNSGIDPEVILAGIQLGGYHIEAGARTFSAYSKAMIQDVGDAVKPYLRSFYEGVRHFPGFDSSGMTASNELDNETDAIENEVTPISTPEPTATIEEVNDDRSKEDAYRPGIQNLDQEDGETVPGGRDGVLAGNVEHETTGYDNVLGISSPEDVRGPEKPGSVEGDGIRPGMQDDGGVGRTESSLDEQFGREAASGTGLDDNGPGGLGRTGGAGIPGEPDRVLENYHIEDPEALIGGTPKVRFKKNQKAIEVFNEVSNEGRRPTAEERDAMASYIGWGSFGQELFQGTFENPTYKDGWANEGEWLRSHLGKSAWESAQASIINAHYTDPPTVSAVWDIVKQLGFNGGRVLEPSMGIGNFFGLMPKGLKSNSDLTGIELDETTSGMAKMLYPEANIQQMGYQDSKTADGFYDLVLGNWPFAAQGPADRRYNKYHLTLHDYFFVKALDQVREGGLVVGITASGTMDKVGKIARRQMGKRADLVAAFRMPAGAFQKYAGTKVVADVIILKKRSEVATANHDAAWLENTVLGKAADGKEIKVNEYWTHKPENVLGNMTIGHGTTQGREGMIVERKQGYEAVLNSLAERLPKNIITKRGQIDHVKYITNNTTERQNSVTIKDNGLYIVRGERLASLDDTLKYSVKDEKETAAREAELKSMVRIRERYGELLDAERNGEKTAENHRAILNQLYKTFVKKYGNMNGSFALKHFVRAGDPMAPAMAALEKNTGTKENPVYEPAKIFTQSTQRQKEEIKNPSISDAFVMTRNEVARVVDLEAIAKKAGTTPDAVKAELIKKDAVFETPAGTFEVKDIYLSGNVREKLREAKAAKEDGLDMDRNIKALEAVIPDDIPYFNIEATMGAAWIPSETYKQFITETANLPDANGIHITPSNNGWIVKFDDAGLIDGRQEVKTIWSTPGASFTKILKSAFTGQAITIKTKDEDGNEYVDKEMSTAANEKVGALREALKDWIWKDVDRRVDLERHYNETMNAWATPAYDGSFLSFDGMMLQKGESEFNLRKHQVNAIWRGVANGRGLYAHEVGTGKTFTMGGIAVESRRYGLAKKPLILGHNANSASVADDIQSMYPGAKVLYIDNLTPKTIDQKLYQIANDDWDAVVLPHSLLDRLTLSRETLDRLAQDEIMSLEEEAIASAAEEGFDIEKILDDEEALRKIRGATTAKEMVKQRNRIIQNIEKQAQAASREGAIPFESLGIDMLIVDEVHEFKKPPLSTKMKVKGLNTTASGRSIGLNFLASYIKEQNNGKGVHIFTGTPITNTLNEIYNHMRYIMSNEMEKSDVLSWDSWFNTFASVESDIERTSSGEYEMVSRLSGFHNVSELRKFAGQYMDIVFAEDMPEFVPRKTKSGKDLHSNDLTDAEREELVNGRVDEGSPSGRPYKKLVNEVADMSEEQLGILQTLVDRAKSFKDASGKERREIMLSGDPRNPVIIETDAAKAGFDPRLYDKELSDHPQNKINRCVNNVLKHYQEHEKASQVIFMEKGYNDQATRSKRDGAGEKATFKVDTFNAAQDLKRKLIEGGIPAGQIAIVNGSVDKKKRMEIANKVNSGEVRVVIGLTSTLGTGTNMQENLRAMHHLDAPWMPGELEQRNGRGHRQGNRWNTVLEYRYITESIDARRWQVLAKKQKMITDFLKAKDGVRSIEGDAVDLGNSDLDEINSSFSEAAGDARILIREKLKKDIEKLERKERTHSQGVVDAKNRIKDIEGRRLPNLKDKVNGLKSDTGHYQSASKEPWAISIHGKKYTKRQEANVALEKMSLKLSTRNLSISEKKKIGSYRGFNIMVSGSVGNGNTYSMERDLSYPIKPSIGSIDFLTRNFPSMLDNTMGQVEEETSALDKFKQVAKEPFAQEKALQSKKESLDQLERDLESNPDAPPSWLAQGAPVGTDVYYKGEKWEVDGHRKGEHGHYVIIKQGENQEVVDYLEVMDENNMPVYETLDGDSGAKYSTSTDAKLNTETAAFRKWFGDSQIVDDDGKPLVVYHGTNNTFTAFDFDKQAGGQLGKGFYFSPDPKVSSMFATIQAKRNSGAGERVIPVYVSIRNPYVIERRSDIPISGINQNVMRHLGYDGVLVKNEGAIDELTVFEPTQIKSIFNTGTWDGSNPDIRYATAKPQDQGIPQIDKAPGQGITIDKIKSQYKNQQITTNPDGTLSILFTNGKGIRVKTVDHIGGDDIRFAMESGRMDKRGVILGKYQDGTVTINKTVANMETAIHENVHALKALGMITQADEKTLNNLTKLLQSQKKYRYEIQEDMEENQANTLAQLVADRANYREGSNVHALIQKIADFFDALFHIGRQSARKLAREYESGKIYSRDTNDKAESIPRFQAAGNTDSEAFKKWFGKSVGKTKDEKPVVFYHGTPNQFTVFEDRAGQSTTHTASGLGHFFTMDKAYANAYAKGSGNVMQVYLKMEKPYMMSLDEAQSFDTVTDAVVKKRRLKLKGYDSVIITVPGAMPMIVVFNPNQIKSVANQGAWNPDNPDIRYSASSDAATMKEHVSAYNQIAAGLKNVISNRKNKGQNYKQDIGVLENTLGLMSHYSEKIPAMKRTFDELMKRPEWKFEKENELSKNGEESMIGTMDDLKKHNKVSYDILKDYLIDNDINQVGAVIFQDEDGTWTIKSEKDKKTGKRKVLEEGIATKQEARALVIEYEVDAYPDPSGSDALRAFRTLTSNLHDFYAESWEAIIKDYEDRGLTLPQVVTKTKSGDVRIDLKVALAQMGDRSSYYFPRQRSNGDWQVYGKKQGGNDFVDYRDNKVTADYLAGKMKAQGYDVEVKKIGSMSEDVYQSVKNILATQAMVNQALNETKLDAKQRTLEDIGLSGEWRGQDYFIPNGGVYEWSSSVLKDLGGMEYSDRGKDGRSWSPGYWFEKAPKDIEELVTNALYISRGQETDISFEISQSLANQLSDTLRARGSRARMIARSDAVGKAVPIGYETDPVSAIAQAVNSAAGGYAKQQVAMNTSKAITGQHYTWEEWQKQHQDYDALVNAEDELSALTKNSETEEERIADIDREIKDLHREGAGVATEPEKARQDRLLRIGKLFREKEKIRKWEDDKQAAKLHQDIARLRSNIHKEYRAYIQDNMLDPKKQKRAYDDAVNAVENVLKNDEAGDRVINTLKGLASVWFLGGRLSSAAINLTAMGTTVPAAMDAYGGIPLQRTMKHIAKAGKAYASFVTGKGNVSQEDRLILEEIFSRGWIAAQLNMETVNALKSGPAKKYGRAVELLMIPFKLTEEFNRGTTILAAYKGIMAENKDMSLEDALLKAKKVSDRAHGIYGVENQPALLRKGRGLRAASAMYIFQTYLHNYLTTLAYMIGRRQAKAATYMVLSPMVFGGAASSLLMPVIKMIFKALDEDDPEEKIYQIAEELFGETGDDIARYGLPGLAGVNFKGSLAPNMPDFQEPLDAMGPIGGMMRNIYDGAVNITNGDYLKGIEKISPLVIGNVAKAYRESTQGVTTRAGDPVFFGNKQIKGDFGTGLMRAAGMNPTKISKPREVQWHETELKQQYAERKRNIYSRIIRYHAQPVSEKNPDEWKDIAMDIKEFNARVKSNDFTDIVPLITHKTIKARVKRAFRPNKRERLRDDM